MAGANLAENRVPVVSGAKQEIGERNANQFEWTFFNLRFLKLKILLIGK